MNRVKWSEKDIQILIEKYPVTPMNILKNLLKMKEHRIYNKAFQLNLKKDAEYLKKSAGRFTSHLSENSKRNQFKKGHKPFNKGMKGFYAKGSEKGWIKKGNKPLNHRPVGTIREVDGYLEIKVAEGLHQWKLLHRIVWERMNGEIPKGYNVRFLDGNSKNIEITNLGLISKSENMKKNSYHENYPKEIAQLIQLQGAITRQINKRANHEQHSNT